MVNYRGEPVEGAVVRACTDLTPTYWRWSPRKTDKSGNFTISVPRDSEAAIELWVDSRDWAPQRVPAPKEGSVLADVRLQRGVRVSGIVTREDGTPVEGTVVAAHSIDDGTLDKVTFAAEVAVKTDAKGRYQLPPLEGMYKVFLSQAERTDDRVDGRYVVADEPPPVVTPQRVALAGRFPLTLDFHAGATLTIGGVIRWPDDRPAAGCQVQVAFLPQGFDTGIWLDDTRTNDQGHYSVNLPRPIDGISIIVAGHHDKHHSWHYGFPADKVKADRKGMQFIDFERLDGDVDGVDWVLRPGESAEAP